MYHHPCVAHTLNLCVNDSLNNVADDNRRLSDLIKKCRFLVSHFKHSVVASATLKSSQEQMGYPILKIKQDVSTRWNSCLIMMERLIKMKDPLCVAVTNLPRAPEFLDASDWAILTDCVLLLKPLESMTTELSGEKYVTMSLVIPLIRGLQHTLKNMSPKSDSGAVLKRNLLDVISKRFGLFETNKIAAKATFLDPRFKKMAFGVEENATNAQKWISDEMVKLMANSGSNIEETNINNEKETQTIQSDCEKDTQVISLWSHFDNRVAQAKDSLSAGTSVSLMIRQYLEMPYLLRNQNPLKFWEKHKYTFPELYKLHLKYLGVPATSVPSERVFSKAGQLTNIRRNRLLPKNVDKIIFLNSFPF